MLPTKTAWGERKTLIEQQADVQVDYLRQSKRVVKTVENEANHHKQRKWVKQNEHKELIKQLERLDKAIEETKAKQDRVIQKLNERKDERRNLVALIRKVRNPICPQDEGSYGIFRQGGRDEHTLATYTHKKVGQTNHRTLNYDRHLATVLKDVERGFSCTVGSTFYQSSPLVK